MGRCSLEVAADSGDLIWEVCVPQQRHASAGYRLEDVYGSSFTVSVHIVSGNRTFGWRGGCSESLLWPTDERKGFIPLSSKLLIPLMLCTRHWAKSYMRAKAILMLESI